MKNDGAVVVYTASQVTPQGNGEIIVATEGVIPPSSEESVVNDGDIEDLIRKEIGKDADIAIAVFKTESVLSPTAMNWNCRYNGVSKQCKPEDRGNAWSVDCGVAQINHIGKDCPAELFDYENNIKVAKGMYDRRGFQPWITYNEGYYLANLK